MRNSHNNHLRQYKLLQKDILKQFPKIELHRHLEGTLDLDILYQIAQKNGIYVPDNLKDFKDSYHFPKASKPDFLAFINKFQINWFKTLEDISTISYESVKNLKEDGIFFIELRFAPHYFARQNNFDPIDITKLIIKSANRAAQEIDIHIRYIITFSRRTQTSEEILKIYNEINSLNFKEIVGIDLAGDEFNFPQKLFIPAFDEIYKLNQHKLTIHAGEVTSSEQVWSAINDLHASRIGHGTSVIHDKKLQKHLKRKKIALEQCITSNSLTGSWKDTEKAHPIGELFRKGVPVTINSDDPSIQNSDLTDEYLKLIHYFNFSLDNLIAINKIALSASFLLEKEKFRKEKQYDQLINQFRTKYEL
ncbi:MAG: adenosine deaminase [Promethearchaeota archaeon]